MSVQYILVIYVGGYIHVSYFDSHKRYKPVLKPSHQRVGLPCFIPMAYCPQGTAGKLIHISEMTGGKGAPFYLQNGSTCRMK